MVGECPITGYLTNRQIAVLDCVARGMTNREIGCVLWIEEHTVRLHINHIGKRLGVRGRIAIIRFALQHGWLGYG